MSLKPPSWLIKSFSKMLDPLERNGDKNTISIKQTFENEPQRDMEQIYVLHIAACNKFTVETYFTYPVSTPINPGSIPFVTVYDSNSAVGTKHEVASALATFSYNYFLSADGGAGGLGKYIVDIRDFTQTQSTGTSITYCNSETGSGCNSGQQCCNGICIDPSSYACCYNYICYGGSKCCNGKCIPDSLYCCGETSCDPSAEACCNGKCYVTLYYFGSCCNDFWCPLPNFCINGQCTAPPI